MCMPCKFPSTTSLRKEKFISKTEAQLFTWWKMVLLTDYENDEYFGKTKSLISFQIFIYLLFFVTGKFHGSRISNDLRTGKNAF